MKEREITLAKSKKSVNLVQAPLRRLAPIFILPTFFAFVIGFVWPFIQGIYLSFCNFNTPKDAKWVGLSNYMKVFQDAGFLNAFKNTAAFAVVSIILINVLAFIIAYALTQKIRGANLFRTVFFMPNLIGGVVLGYIWSMIFDGILKNYGTYLTANGIDPDKDLTIEYYSEAAEVTAQMALATDAIAVLPQPYVTAAGMQDETLRVALDLTEEWEKVSENSLITGVTVVRTEYAEAHPEVIEAFLADYAASVEAANTDLEGTAALCEEQGVVAKAAIAMKALPACKIVCRTGEELRADAEGYLQVLYDADPASVGGAMPDDGFYYTAE